MDSHARAHGAPVPEISLPPEGEGSRSHSILTDEGENTMSLVVNHNMMAANVARNLNAHYGNLSTSTQRLSTGMRINSAADDAAGLAISELQRADIAALQQGARNANDAISLIQTADGAMGVIDEKLIRMKELAEQAATGTYDSTQRLMIESEYQQMASEITRIANATDFNGIKLLDGTLSGVHDGSQMTATGALKVHFGSGNDSAEDYYYIEIGDVTAQALGLGNSSTYEEDKNRMIAEYKAHLQKNMKGWDRGEAWQKEAYDQIQDFVNEFAGALDALETALRTPGTDVANNDLHRLANAWSALSADKKQLYGKGLPSENMPPRMEEITNANGQTTWVNQFEQMSERDQEKVLYAYTRALVDSWGDADTDANPSQTSFGGADVNNNNGLNLPKLNNTQFLANIGTSAGNAAYNAALAAGQTQQQANDARNAANAAAQADAKAAVMDALHSMSVSLTTKYDAAGRDIRTQEDAQLALDAINNAIIEKDKIRAHIGALQNRLENTITNLNVQAENLQAAESRIRDVDVATEMTEFTRQQVLTQSAVAMLSQANSLPQMAMQLIGG